MDIKTILIGGGLLFVLWSCAGVSAAPATMSTAPTIGPSTPERLGDPANCYSQIHGAVRADWAQLSRAQRAIIGFQSIQACEGSEYPRGGGPGGAEGRP